MNRKDNFITFILVFLMIIVLSVTIYFCLDVFGIIKVPEKYSIASLFYSQIEVIATGGEILPENIVVQDNEKQETDLEEDSNATKDEEEPVEIVENPLEHYYNNQNNQKEDFSDNLSVNNFYYNQLDEYGKIMYDELYTNIDKLKTGTYLADFDTKFDDLLHQDNGKEILENSFQLAINSLTFDNPELFYIDITKVHLITEIRNMYFKKTYRVSIGGNGQSYLADEFLNEQDINKAIDDVRKQKLDIIENARKSSDNIIDQLKVVHDWLVDSVEYDSNAGKNIYNIYGPLINKKAVCEGYARSFKYILDEMGIPCIVACGLAQNRLGAIESHAWNYVQIDGNWYAVDVTWDDPIINGNGRLTKQVKYKYFFVGSDEFFKDHTEDGNIVGEYKFDYPEISTTNY